VADAGGEPLHLEQVFELSGTTLAFSERARDAQGATVRGRAVDAPYLFRRQAPPAH
jgi:hypothetical protein